LINRSDVSSEPADAPDADAENGATIEDTDLDVGQRLRAMRQLRGWTLQRVADKAGLSPSFLSQVERGRAATSIASLKRIATALDLSMSDLFEPNMLEKPRVLKHQARPVLAFGHLGRKFLLTPRPLQFLEVFVGEFEPEGTTGEPYSHGDSEEFFMVLEGRVQLTVDSELYEMEQGDSITYGSKSLHRVTNPSSEPAQVLWVISPPSY
jgi:transcriptional regulator with XRE-family HTH domain